MASRLTRFKSGVGADPLHWWYIMYPHWHGSSRNLHREGLVVATTETGWWRPGHTPTGLGPPDAPPVAGYEACESLLTNLTSKNSRCTQSWPGLPPGKRHGADCTIPPARTRT